MKVGDTVKLKPEMWQKWKLKPESYGLSFEGKYVVEEVIEYATYAKIKLVGLDEEWEQDHFQPYKTTFKVKVYDKELYEVEELEDGSWKVYFYDNIPPFTYPKSSVDKFLNDGSWEIIKEEEKQLKKFKTGDKVICIKNTPSIQEGWVGYVEKVDFKSDEECVITARQECSMTTYEFLSDELEVLSREENLKPSKDKLEAVHSPKHYAVFDDIEAIEIIARSMTKEMFKGYCFGNLLKYRLRAGNKDDVKQELGKADKYKELYEKYKDLCQ